MDHVRRLPGSEAGQEPTPRLCLKTLKESIPGIVPGHLEAGHRVAGDPVGLHETLEAKDIEAGRKTIASVPPAMYVS